MTHPYRYLISSANAAELIDELCSWHDRMVAHVRRHGASSQDCTCEDTDSCPSHEAVGLWAQARLALGETATSLTFLRQHAEANDRA